MLPLSSAEKNFLIQVRYGSVLQIPASKDKNKVYFSNTKTIPKEGLKYQIMLTKNHKEFKVINLYCNSNFTIVTFQHFKILLVVPKISLDEKCDL